MFAQLPENGRKCWRKLDLYQNSGAAQNSNEDICLWGKYQMVVLNHGMKEVQEEILQSVVLFVQENFETMSFQQDKYVR